MQEYFKVLVYRDLAERYQISNTVALKFFLKRLILSLTKPISINKIYNEFKSNGIKISKNTLYDFLEYSQNAYRGKSLKNAVFLELKRRGKELFYYRDESIEKEETTKIREVKGILAACKKFNLKSGTIITSEIEEEIVLNSITIKFIPFYKWSTAKE